MRIAIDLDKTIFECNSLAYKLANSFLQREKIKKLKCTFLQPDFEENKGLIYKLICNNIAFCNYDKFFEVGDCVEAIKRLKKDGHEIYFLSKRPDLKIFTNVIYKWFRSHHLPIKNIVVNCNSKVSFCKVLNIDMLIDDDQQTCQVAAEHGIKAIRIQRDLQNPWGDIMSRVKGLEKFSNQRIIKSLANTGSL